MQLKNKIVIFIFSIICLFSFCFKMSAFAATNPFVDTYVIDTTKTLSKETIKEINSINEKATGNTHVYVYVADGDKLDESFSYFTQNLYEENLNKYDIVIGLDFKNRKMEIGQRSYDYSKSSLIEEYAKASFSKDDFDAATIQLVNGAFKEAAKLNAEEEESQTTSLVTYPTVKLESRITDTVGLLSQEEIDNLEANAYKLYNNYDKNIYVLLTNAEEYDTTEYTNSIYRDNFQSLSSNILVVFYMDTQKISVFNNNTSIDIISLYEENAKAYFHKNPAQYAEGIMKLQDAVVMAASSATEEDLSEITSAGTVETKTDEDYQVTNWHVKNFFLITLSLVLIIGIIIVIGKVLMTIEKNKSELLNNKPKEAFKELEKEIKKDEKFLTEKKMNDSVNDLYKTVAEEMNEKSLEKREYKKNNKNSFNISSDDEQTMVTESINSMIKKVVSKSKGTKEDYETLQSALDVYNSLQFSDRIKLDRKYTSELETLTRKAKQDKEMFERLSTQGGH